MPPIKHSKYSASGASRWLRCTASIGVIEEAYRDNIIHDKETSYATEGTENHAWLEKILAGEANVSDVPEEHQDPINQVVEYVDRVRSSMDKPKQELELRVNYHHIAPEGFGTCDIILHDSNQMNILDLKYGMGVRVVAEKNNQLMLYACGALKTLNIKPKEISLHVMQPRLNNFSKWDIGITQIEKFERGVKRITNKIEAGDVKFNPSEEVCRFCDAKPVCKEYRQHVESSILMAFESSNTLSPLELSGVIQKKKEYIAWLNNVEENVIRRMESGESFPGLSLGETKGRKKWKDNALDELKSLLGDKAFKETPIGLTQARKLLSKDKIEELTESGKTSPKIIIKEDK